MSSDESRALAHVVFFCLKERTDTRRRKLVDSCLEHLTGHPGVTYFSVGERASEFDRPVNDDRFDVALHVIFDSLASHDAYQASARHQAFLQANQQGWSEVRVFDSYVAPGR